MYKYSCISCHGVFEYPEDIRGRKIECPECNHKFVIKDYYSERKKNETKRSVRSSSSRSTRATKVPTKQSNKKKTILILLSSVSLIVILGVIVLFSNKTDSVVEVGTETTSKQSGEVVNESKQNSSLVKNSKELLRSSCDFYEVLRTEHGFYLDLVRPTSKKADYRVSAASTGIGLVSLCIADKMKFDSDAEQKVIQSLKGCLGLIAGVKPARNKTGMYRHFFDSRTGERWGKSEFSTIDTALLISGVVFCKNNFPENKTIQALADRLWHSIDWTTSKVDQYHYYLTQDELGNGGSGRTRIFNEYILLADYCSYALGEEPLNDMHNWPRKAYGELEVLTDTQSHYLPLFTFQFPLYLSPFRANSPEFLKESLLAGQVDKLWWQKQTGKNALWGSSAGAGLKGYSVDSTAKNDSLIVCAPSIAGFMPFEKVYQKDFNLILKNYPSVMSTADGVTVPWRFSHLMKDWRPGGIQGIDYAPMLFGLASLEENLGFEFFQKSSRLNFK